MGMCIDEDGLIERLKRVVEMGKRPQGDEYEWVEEMLGREVVRRRVVTLDEIEEAERLLGFALPPFLKRVYMEIGDGGWGPGYGLVPLLEVIDEEGDAVVSTTLAYRGEGWSNRLLFMCDWGCNICSSIDCAKGDYSVVRTEEGWHRGIESGSLQEWLSDWLEGKELFALGQDEEKLSPVNRMSHGSKRD